MAWRTNVDRRDDKAERQAAEAYWDSPMGQAAAAKLRGDRFFQVEIEAALVSGNSYSAFGMGFDVSRTRRHDGATDLLSEIEGLGWQLEHVSHVFVTTGASARAKQLSRGAMMSTSGRIEGVYLFRATEAELDPEEVPFYDYWPA